MRKYLILADGNSPHTFKWIKELDKSFDIYLISFNGIRDSIYEFIPKCNVFDLKTTISINGNNVKVLNFIFTVAKIIKKVKPNFINAHYITSYGTIGVLSKILARSNAKLILSAWGTDILVTPFKNRVYYYLTKFILMKADFVTSDSEYMAKFIRNFNVKNVLIFPFGINKFPNVKKCNKDYNYFFSNRALEPNYNIKLVIDLFKKLYDNDNNLNLIIANDGSERRYLEQYVIGLGLERNVLFTGYLTFKEMAYYYEKCGYYFSLPKSDSTSVSLLEAMSYGCIPIVSNIPANLEWIKNGENGFVIADTFIGNEIVYLETAFDKNRSLILNNAIWSRCIKQYIEKIKGNEV